MEACIKWKKLIQAQNPVELHDLLFVYMNKLESIR